MADAEVPAPLAAVVSMPEASPQPDRPAPASVAAGEARKTDVKTAGKRRRDTSGRWGPFGQTQMGLASYYAHKFTGRLMADGTRMDPASNSAASTTLPLGTRARVTNLLTGQSAIVIIRDRGPFIKGRIIDVSISIAHRLSLMKAGVVPVQVVALNDKTLHDEMAAQ